MISLLIVPSEGSPVAVYVIDEGEMQALADAVAPMQVLRTVQPSKTAAPAPARRNASPAPALPPAKPAGKAKAPGKTSGPKCPGCEGVGASRRWGYCADCWGKLSPSAQAAIKDGAAGRKRKGKAAPVETPAAEPAADPDASA